MTLDPPLNVLSFAPGTHTVEVSLPTTVPGPLTFLVAMQDSDADLNRSGQTRYALQQSQRTPPPTLQASAGPGEVVLAWNQVQAGPGYKFKRRKAAEGDYADIDVPAGVANGIFSYTCDTDPRLIPGSTYYYRQFDTNSPNTPVSNEVSAVPGDIPMITILSSSLACGWAALTNPYNSSLDWHGLDLLKIGTDPNGNALRATTHSYAAGFYPAGAADNFSTDLIGNDSGQTPLLQKETLGSSHESLDLTWVWAPPGGDLIDFPTPPLFVLAKTASSLDVTGSTLTAVDAGGNQINVPTKILTSGTLNGVTNASANPVSIVSLSLGAFSPGATTWLTPSNGTSVAGRQVVPATSPLTPAASGNNLSYPDRLVTTPLTPSSSPLVSLSLSNPPGNGSARIGAGLYQFGFPIHMTCILSLLD